MNPFIVFEAINAAGKTTQFNLLLEKLKQAGYNTYSIHFHQRERATGQLIENKFLHSQTKKFTRREQALIFIQDFFSRSEDIYKTLNQKGKSIVVLDRFYSSTMAYQTIGLSGSQRQHMLNWMSWLCEKGEPKLPKPNLVILLDTPVDISVSHLKTNQKKDYFENRKRLIAIRRSYLALAKERRWTIINSVDEQGKQRTIPDIHQEIWSKIQKVL